MTVLMDAAKIVTLHCDISNLPEGMRFVCFKDIEEYDKISYLVYKQLTLDNPDLLHCLCWAHVYNNFDDALVISGERDAEKLLRKKGSKYSALMLKALNYMLNGWNELLNYRNDGRYTIDNLPAERAIRPVTVARKNSLHYSSEEGLQVALTYMTVIETVKMLGMDAKDFLVRAWKEAIYGNNDMESLLLPVPVCK